MRNEVGKIKLPETKRFPPSTVPLVFWTLKLLYFTWLPQNYQPCFVFVFVLKWRLILLWLQEDRGQRELCFFTPQQLILQRGRQQGAELKVALAIGATNKYNSPSPCMSQVQSVKLSLRSCMINVLSLYLSSSRVSILIMASSNAVLANRHARSGELRIS